MCKGTRRSLVGLKTKSCKSCMGRSIKMCFAVGEVCHYVRAKHTRKKCARVMKFRLLVLGHLEPDEWKTGAKGAPVVGDSAFRQLIAAGLDEDDSKLKGTLKNRK